MAKAPVAGRVKTRLIPALGADGAAALAEQGLQHAVRSACEARLGEVVLCASPDADHPGFERMRVSHGVRLIVQGDGDLGARMHRAFMQVLQRADGEADRSDRALLIGTDAPALDAPMLRAAASGLDEADVCFVPALDGGYVLVGLRRSRAELFVGIDWSTDQVMAQTRTRADILGLRRIELPAVADIDSPADLAFAPASWRCSPA